MVHINDIHDCRIFNVPNVTQHTVNPGDDDDRSKGYNVGDLWINNEWLMIFACVRNNPGAASWIVLAATPQPKRWREIIDGLKAKDAESTFPAPKMRRRAPEPERAGPPTRTE